MIVGYKQGFIHTGVTIRKGLIDASRVYKNQARMIPQI
jgi:hypothetical protein